ncbi:MAG: glucarate dehydratase family protein [Acidimicrobiales bacterium]
MTRIERVTVTPVAFRDPPLLNAVGVHEPFALRSIIQLHTNDGLVGLGESYGDDDHLDRLRMVGDAMIGLDPFHTHRLRELTVRVLGARVGSDTHGLTGHMSVAGTALRTFASFEVACLDLQGKVLDRPVSDLLGGAVRERVPYSAYLFYKWAGHPGARPDPYGEALDPEGIVAQARWMLDTYGFGAIKLKGGVFEPEREIDAVVALRDAFPNVPLRLDPNAAWSVATSIRVATRLAGVLEYLEDPTPTRAAMAEVAREVETPLATNMCVVGFEDIRDAVQRGSVGVILADHHYWGGLRASVELAGICRTFDLGLSMHSNSHLGISLAAMTHLAATVPNLSYALDTHWPWKDDDVVVPGVLNFVDGALRVPSGPGLGVELDEESLARLHHQYIQSGLSKRDDTAYMRRFVPDYESKSPRW